MYKVGFGDCFLITLPRSNRSNYYMLIDCGVILGTPNAEERMSRIVDDIVTTTKGSIDLLAVTHEHWDHVSGFVQAAEAFGRLQVDQVWLAWTEDPDDELAQKLARERAELVDGLRRGLSRLQAAGDAAAVAELGGLLEFFGASSGPTTRDALNAARKKVAKPRYCHPKDSPVQLKDPRVTLYTFGPPPDEKLLKKTRDSTKNPETFGVALAAFRDHLDPVLQAAPESPFGTLYAIPMHVAQDMAFFKSQYWGRDRWRRIDTAWLGDTSELALQLDNATNNTCLVLAVELGQGGDVLLFAGDAQIGNWLSWEALSWQVGARTVTARDLLGRTILYKVGHHGSSNATLVAKGLDLMGRLQVAMVSVDTDVAKLRNWLRLPSRQLIDRLDDQTRGGLVQADKAAPARLLSNRKVTEHELYYEVEV